MGLLSLLSRSTPNSKSLLSHLSCSKPSLSLHRHISTGASSGPWEHEDLCVPSSTVRQTARDILKTGICRLRSDVSNGYFKSHLSATHVDEVISSSDDKKVIKNVQTQIQLLFAKPPKGAGFNIEIYEDFLKRLHLMKYSYDMVELLLHPFLKGLFKRTVDDVNSIQIFRTFTRTEFPLTKSKTKQYGNWRLKYNELALEDNQYRLNHVNFPILDTEFKDPLMAVPYKEIEHVNGLRHYGRAGYALLERHVYHHKNDWSPLRVTGPGQPWTGPRDFRRFFYLDETFYNLNKVLGPVTLDVHVFNCYCFRWYPELRLYLFRDLPYY